MICSIALCLLQQIAKIFFEIAAMPFPCIGPMLCCVNLQQQYSINFFIGGDLALALNSLGWFTQIVSQEVFLFYSGQFT